MKDRIFLWTVFLQTAAFAAGWQRSVDSAKGFTDSPPPHGLAYFLVDPCLRPESDSLVRALECVPGDATPVELDRRAKTRTEMYEIGQIGEFMIYGLWYQRGIDPRFDRDLRSVLVRTGQDQYREIDTRLRRGDMFPDSEIVQLGTEPILIIKSHDGGNHSRVDEDLFLIRSTGMERADLSAVEETVRRLLPANMSVATTTDDYEKMTRVVETYRNDLNIPRVSVTDRGRITVTYGFANGLASVVSSSYQPYSVE